MRLFINVLLLLLSITAKSQKIPKTQTNSVKMPEKTVVNGIDEEWDGKFCAYNPKLRMSYSISNNDSNLYLSFKVTDKLAIRKILLGGIEINIGRTKKNGRDAMSQVVFPKYNRQYTWYFTRLDEISGRISNSKAIDSVRILRNHLIDQKMKLVGVKRLKSLPDSVMSVYNLSPVKVKSRFDAQLSYIFEFMIPLKEFGLDVKNDRQFYYEIVLKGVSAGESDIIVDEERKILRITGTNIENTRLPLNAEYLELAFPTSFSGQCKLAY